MQVSKNIIPRLYPYFGKMKKPFFAQTYLLKRESFVQCLSCAEVHFCQKKPNQNLRKEILHLSTDLIDVPSFQVHTHTRRAKVKHLMHQIYDICQIFSSTQPNCVINLKQIDKGSCYQKHFLSSEVSTFQVNPMQNLKVEGSILGMQFQKKFLK